MLTVKDDSLEPPDFISEEDHRKECTECGYLFYRDTPKSIILPEICETEICHNCLYSEGHISPLLYQIFSALSAAREGN